MHDRIRFDVQFPQTKTPYRSNPGQHSGLDLDVRLEACALAGFELLPVANLPQESFRGQSRLFKCPPRQRISLMLWWGRAVRIWIVRDFEEGRVL